MTDIKPLLMDTHVLIWFFEDIGDLSKATIQKIEESAMQDKLLVSAISIWEIANLNSRGRVKLGLPVEKWVNALLETPGLRLVPLSPEIACRSCDLQDFHKDPADRIIVATSLINQVKLVTRDRQIIEYKPMRNLTEMV